MDFEPAFWKAALASPFKPKIPVVPFVPERRETPARQLTTVSAWAGIESILADLIQRFELKTDSALEFGVEHGYSSVALSSYFNAVTGVDTFRGDKHNKIKEDLYDAAVARLAPFSNITLHRSDYREWITSDRHHYNLIHVDIVHTYQATFDCGLWSAQHSDCTIFHDTESFREVKLACRDIARITGRRFFNYEPSNGLGILVP